MLKLKILHGLSLFLPDNFCESSAAGKVLRADRVERTRDGGESGLEGGASGKGVRREDEPGGKIHPRKVQRQRALPEREFVEAESEVVARDWTRVESTGGVQRVVQPVFPPLGRQLCG